MSDAEDEADRQLVLHALHRVEDEPNHSKAARLLGVSEGLIRKWRAGVIGVPLKDKTRETLRNTKEAVVVRERRREWVTPAFDSVIQLLEQEAESAKMRAEAKRLEAQAELEAEAAARLRAEAIARLVRRSEGNPPAASGSPTGESAPDRATA